MAGAREVWRGRKWTEKDIGEAGNIDLLGQRQVTPRWEDDPVQRYIGRQWRACWGRRGLPPPGSTSCGVKGGWDETSINMYQ